MNPSPSVPNLNVNPASSAQAGPATSGGSSIKGGEVIFGKVVIAPDNVKSLVIPALIVFAGFVFFKWR